MLLSLCTKALQTLSASCSRLCTNHRPSLHGSRAGTPKSQFVRNPNLLHRSYSAQKPTVCRKAQRESPLLCLLCTQRIAAMKMPRCPPQNCIKNSMLFWSSLTPASSSCSRSSDAKFKGGVHMYFWVISPGVGTIRVDAMEASPEAENSRIFGL